MIKSKLKFSNRIIGAVVEPFLFQVYLDLRKQSKGNLAYDLHEIFIYFIIIIITIIIIVIVILVVIENIKIHVQMGSNKCLLRRKGVTIRG